MAALTGGNLALRIGVRIAPILLLAAGCPPAEPAAWTTLGTNGGPLPNAERKEPANLLRSRAASILVDVGDGATGQLAAAGVPLAALRTVMISHLHFDHVGGLFALLGQRYQLRTPGVLTIYGPAGTKRMIDGLLAAMAPSPAAGLWRGADARAGLQVIELADGAQVQIADIKVTAAANSHYAQTPSADQGSSLSYRFDTPGRSIVYTGDTGPSTAVEHLARGADLLVSEVMEIDRAMALFAAQQPHTSPDALAALHAHLAAEHLSPEAAGLLAGHAGVKALVLTHNPTAVKDVEQMRPAIAAHFRGSIGFARDLDCF